MDKLETIKKLLADVGMPDKQQSDLCSLTMLGLANLKEDDSFKKASNDWIRMHDVIQFINENYGVTYAENSRETFRKQAMHHFRNAALIEDNGKATNSPNYRYRITSDFLNVLKSIGTKKENLSLQNFLSVHEKLVDTYASKKTMPMMPVKINNVDYVLSPGSHNQLQKAILEEFCTAICS